MSFDPSKDINFRFKDDGGNVKEGVLHLVADLTSGEIQKIINNVLNVDLKVGLSMDSINYTEFIVQMAQKLIKTAPQGFDVNKPDNIRNLRPETWSAIEDFIGENYPLMDFLQLRLKVLFGMKLLGQGSPQHTGST